MEIVIDIDDDMYKSVANNDAYILGDVDWILLENAIANGIPLPEHHGRLIDADALADKGKYYSNENESFFYIYSEDVAYAPTIIEGSDSE